MGTPLLTPLTSMSVATTHSDANPRILSHNRSYTQKAQGNTNFNLSEWWNNVGEGIYNNLIQAGKINTSVQTPTQTTPENSGASTQTTEYTPGSMLSGVMSKVFSGMEGLNFNPAIAYDYKVADPTVESATGVSNFDSPAFDPNAGKQELRDAAYKEYMQGLINSGKRRINVRRETRNFDKYFDQRWDSEEAERRSAHNTLMRQTREKAFNDYWDGRIKASEEATAQAYKNEGYVFDEATGQWNKPEAPKNLTEGLDFNNVQNVQQWLIDKGYDVGKAGADDLYGQDTRAAIQKLLSAENSGLTDADRQSFNQFMDSNRLVGHKQKINPEVVKQAEVKETPATVNTSVVEQPIQNQSQQAIVEEKPVYYDTKYIPRQGEIVLNPETQNNSSTLDKVPYKQNHWGHRWAKPFEGATGLGKSLHDAFIWMGDNGMFQKKPNYGGTGALHKQGGTLIKKHQQGGNMEQQEQQEFMAFLIVSTSDDTKLTFFVNLSLTLFHIIS